MKRLFNNRKTLYLILGFVLVSVFTLTIAYSALNTILKINGDAEVLSASWDIYLDNVRVNDGSVNSNIPIITERSTLSFDAILDKPGDYYEFLVDVVNDGTIDAMIDSVVKTPELTEEQAKFINYEITYQNGENINIRQKISKKTRMPIKVRIEYRSDLNSTDLPKNEVKLNLSFTLLYAQSEGEVSSVLNNGGFNPVEIINGDLNTVGSEVCIEEECFYVISSTESTSTLFAKYNLHVGSYVDQSYVPKLLEEPTGRQNENAIGFWSYFPWVGITYFATTEKHGVNLNSYEGSIAEEYVNEYVQYLSSLNATILESRLITKDELVKLGCGTFDCKDAPSWVYNTSFWTQTPPGTNTTMLWYVNRGATFDSDATVNESIVLGVRPVIVIPNN